MFVQHMLAVLRSGGTVVTVMPHGVLFRGGAEKEIRTGLLDEDMLDTVIGLGPQLFYRSSTVARCARSWKRRGCRENADGALAGVVTRRACWARSPRTAAVRTPRWR